MKKTILTLLALVSCVAAHAEWQPVGIDNKGGKAISLDRSTIRRAGSTVKVWTLVDYRDRQFTDDGKAYRSVRMQMRIDCAAETFQSLTASIHSEPKASGSIVLDAKRAMPMQPVAPNTPAAILMSEVCDQ